MYQFFSALCWYTYLPLTSTCSVLRSGDIPTVPSSDFYLPSFAFCWCSYRILFSSFSLLHSGDVPTVPSFDFYLPSFVFCWFTYHCFLFLIRFPSLSCWKPISYTLNPTCKSFLAQCWRIYTLVPSYRPPIHLYIFSRFCRIFSNQAISKSWFRIIWPWLLSWLIQTAFVSMFWHDVDVVVLECSKWFASSCEMTVVAPLW